MKRKIIKRLNWVLKSKLFQSLLIIALMTASISGATYSWFYHSDTVQNVFTAGTVRVAVYDSPIVVASSGESCRTVKWILKNEGSKKSYIRFKIIDKPLIAGETAWAEGERFVNPGNWAMYFTVGVGEEKTVRFLAGQTIEIGTVKVWNDDQNLYVQYKTDFGWTMERTQLAVADNFDLIPTNPSGNPKIGNFPFKDELGNASEFTRVIPLSGTYPDGSLKGQSYSWTPGESIYIAAHSDVTINATAQWSVSDQYAGWEKWLKGFDNDGNWDGYWYYQDPVESGQEIMVHFNVCLPGNTAKGKVDFQLEIEAVQASNCAIDHQWPTHPWYPICQ